MKAGEANPHIIYERNYYQHLLSILTSKSLIVGTTYTGKTSFLFYHLARLVNSNNGSVFEPLPLACPGGDQQLNVVIYRTGSELTLYFLDDLKAYTYTNVTNDYRLLNCFNSFKTLCFYDNKESLSTVSRTNEIISVLTHSCFPIIVTATPPEFNPYTVKNNVKQAENFYLVN